MPGEAIAGLSLNAQVNEAGNGALMIVSASAAVFFARSVLRAWAESGTHGTLRSRVRRFYTWENKAAIGMLTLAVGGTMKCVAEWGYLHGANHPGSTIGSGGTLGLVAFTVGTMVALWGFICLMRALSFEVWNPWSWLWLSGMAVLFGIVTAL